VDESRSDPARESQGYWDDVWASSGNQGSYAGVESRMERALDKVGYFIQNGFPLKQGSRVLEAGCGDGMILLSMMRLVEIQGYGLDFSTNARARAEDLMAHEGNRFEFVHGRLDGLPFEDDHFDLAVCLGVIEHVPDPTEQIRELHRVMKPGGHLVMMTPNRLSFGVADRLLKTWFGAWPYGYQTEYSPRKLASLMSEQGFRIDKYCAYPRQRLAKDSRAFKAISLLDRFLGTVLAHWGFYSYVFARKDA